MTKGNPIAPPPFLQPAAFPRGVTAAFSTRVGGVSAAPFGLNLSFHVGDLEEHVRGNRELFFGGIGIASGELAIPGQVHSAVVQRVSGPGMYPACDALVTTATRVFLCVSFADCVPILLVDPVARVAAAVHAGWRGTASRILEATLRMMTEECGASVVRIRACIGPAAGGCCYAVGPEVASAFEPAVQRIAAGRTYVDLKGENARQLYRAGVSAEHVEVMPYCTIGEGGRFHSYRREQAVSGRMMGVVGFHQ